jgi:hypothetical protein
VLGDPYAALAQLEGDCSQYDPEIWFGTTKQEKQFAKRVCAGCPALLKCQTITLDAELHGNADLYGIFGGLDEKERRQIRHQKRRRA